ncbi:MAG: hypothetical protein E6J06_05385 [Chloroflexi bacterium]|nr:MAG: hypothetical protein E6J06_05385 [Chloroflexota bacterium]
MRRMALLSLMGTLPHVSAPRKVAALLALVAATAACGGGSPNIVAGHSPSQGSPQASSTPSSLPSSAASPTQGPQPVNGAFAVLVSSQAATSYSVSVIGVDGKVVASAQAGTPSQVSCANAAAALVPLPVSTSSSRVYFMDAQGVVRFLGPGGDTGRATTVPAGTASRRSMFAVSPDDQRIAVIVDDFTAAGASTRLYVEDLTAGGNHVDLFSETGAFTLWPIGWHGSNNLVVAKVASCTQGGGAFCCGPLELHVIDPATATRRFTLGNSSSCVIAGSPSPAGVVCENTSNFTSATVLNWTAGTVRTLALNGPSLAYVSPSGGMVAMVDNTGTSFTVGAASINGLFACTWIDDTHVLSGGDSQHQPRVAEITAGAMVPVAAQGDCGGRIPGGL